MKLNKIYALITLATLLLSGCSPQEMSERALDTMFNEKTEEAAHEIIDKTFDVIASPDTKDTVNAFSESLGKAGDDFRDEVLDPALEKNDIDPTIINALIGLRTAPTEEVSKETLTILPVYEGEPVTIINDNVPFFTENEITTESFENYSELDALDRCGIATACIGKDIMPTQKRESIGMVKPSGWKQGKYPNIIPEEPAYLYNRCHLIAFELAGENANNKNLITGTRYMNVSGMLPYENEVASYVRQTNNHVMYRVTPVFVEDELVARGVLIEAKSVEDDQISICAYCHNIQPGIVIDYATGDNHAEN